MSDRSVVVRLRAEIGNFRDQMRGAAAATRDVGTAAAGSQGTLRGLASHARENESAWNTAGTSLLGFGAAAVAGFGLAMKTYADFDQAMSEVKASTHESAQNMDLLRAAAIDAGADTAFSAKEAAQGIDELAKAGVSTADVLGGGLTGALSLAAAGSLGVGDAAEIAATALTQFKLGGEDIPHVADLLAAGAGKAQGSVSDMGNALKQSGLVASQTGLTIEETTGGLAAFASAGLVGSDAGTSFKSMLQRLTPQSKEAQKKMDELGISAYDAQGNFIGLSAFSGQLQNSMKDLDSESRNAAMGVIFGSDAVRAANVLYEQGQSGISGWIDAVDEAGFAASTAAIKQDNLAGDLEKLGGSFDTVLIQGGGGAATALRSVVQGAEDLIDMIGGLKPEVIGTGFALAGAVGGAALLGGAFLTLLPKVLEARRAFIALQTAGGPLAGNLGKVGKVAGIAAVALAGLAIAGAVFSTKTITSTSDYANAIMKVSEAGKEAKASDLGSVFEKWDRTGGLDLAFGSLNNMHDAIGKISNPSFIDGYRKALDPLYNIVGISSPLKQAEERVKGLGDALGELTSQGGHESAAKSFNLVAKEFEASGKSAQEALDKMPGYKDALLDIGNAAGVALQPHELLMLAQGQMPARLKNAQTAMESQAAAAEADAQQIETLNSELEEIGVSASGAVTNLDAFTQSLVEAGLLTLSSRDAARGYKDSIDTFTESLKKNGPTLDINTKKGRENQATLDGIAKAGIASAEAIAKDTKAYKNSTDQQAAVQSALTGTYNDLLKNAQAAGMSKDKADEYARSVLNIPKEANVKTWIDDFANAKAKEIKSSLDAIPTYKKITVDYENTTTNRVININSTSHIAEGAGGRGGMTKAEGGAVFGPGTGTSDDIPAWLSNGEHVLTAAEVVAMGGHGSVERLRAAALQGDMPAFASGGKVKKETAAQRAARLKKQVEDRRKAQEAKRKAEAEARQKLAQYRAEQGFEFWQDKARGDGYTSVTEGLSSAYSYSDKLRSVANSGFANSSKSALNTAAYRGDNQMRTLYARTESLGKSLDTAKKRFDDLASVKSGVSSDLQGEFSLADALKQSARYTGKSSIAGVQAAANAKLASIRDFGAKLNKLAIKGYSGAIVQEIAAMGSDAGGKAADTLLAGSATDVKNLNSSYQEIAKASDAAGTAVTAAMFKGGVNAAQGIVKGLESQQAAIEKQMLKIGLSMEKELKKALGIKSPSRVARAIGSNFGGSVALGVEDELPTVATQVKSLGESMYIAPSQSMSGVYSPQSVSVASYGSGSGWDTAALDRLTEAVKGQRPIVVNELSTPRATAMAVTREQEG